MAEMREFDTGATRNVDTDKHDPEGFLSPRVIVAFNEYMHKHRFQADGKMRDSDNWQKGIPKEAYMKSMWRHFLDVWCHHRGVGQIAKEPLREALVALLFNVMGYLDVILKQDDLQAQSPQEAYKQRMTQAQANGLPPFISGLGLGKL